MTATVTAVSTGAAAEEATTAAGAKETTTAAVDVEPAATQQTSTAGIRIRRKQTFKMMM